MSNSQWHPLRKHTFTLFLMEVFYKKYMWDFCIIEREGHNKNVHLLKQKNDDI